VAAPVDSLYFPAAHAVQEPPFAPVDPALQVQLVEAVLPAGELEFDGQPRHIPEVAVAPTLAEYLPAAQSEQVAFPVNALYFPATHTAHGPPSGPVYPALQVQLVCTVLPAGEREPEPQKLQYRLPRPTAGDQ
jgi:hypothetical protein